MPQSSAINAVFVYGTLKRGQCREGLWPEPPLEVEWAWIFGDLWGRDDYPALVDGSRRVLGELWRFEPDQMPRVLEVLDAIEGTSGNSADDLYHRIVVNAFDLNRDVKRPAYTYRYNRDLARGGFRPLPVEAGQQQWPGSDAPRRPQ